MQRNGKNVRIRWACARAARLVAAGGCTSVKMTGTARTGTEQLLLTGTWDDALCRVDFRPLAGTKVFVDPQYISTVVDKDWVDLQHPPHDGRARACCSRTTRTRPR